MDSFSLNFSRPAAPIITQYFNLIHLGFEGYRTIALNDLKNARLLSRALERSTYYSVLSDIHRPAEGLSSTLKQATVGMDDNVEVCHNCWSPLYVDLFVELRSRSSGGLVPILGRVQRQVSGNSTSLDSNLAPRERMDRTQLRVGSRFTGRSDSPCGRSGELHRSGMSHPIFMVLLDLKI